MKILELNFAKTWRGGERQTLYNAEGFIAAGHAVTLLCRRGSPLEKKSRTAGLTVFSFRHIPALVWFLICNGRKYDYLHAQTSHILTYCLLSRPFHRRKIIFTRRIDFVPHGRFTRFKYRQADYRVGISSAVQSIVETFCGLPVSMISDIAVPAPTDRNRAVKWLQQNGIPENVSIIATTAALVQHKDPLTLVNAISLLSARRSDFIFLHFGEGELRDEVASRIAGLKLEKVFRLCGFKEGIEDFFTIFNVFVMSSEEEGLGSSVLDAFLYKVPVVSTCAGGLADLIGEGRGISCPVHDAAALADGMEKLLDNKTEMQIQTEAAEAYVLEKHSSAFVTRGYLAMLTI